MRKNVKMSDFCKRAFIRMFKTFIQTILGMWTAGLLITEIDWKTVLVTASSAAIYSLLTSILTGLPETDKVDYVGLPEGGEVDG